MMDFYASLKNFMAADVAEKSNKKLPNIDDMDIILSMIDSSMDRGKEKEFLVAASYLLAKFYKNKLWAIRSKNLKLYAKQAARAQNPKLTPTSSSDSELSDKKPSRGFKVNKLDCITDSFSRCTSTQIKLAVAIFLSSNFVDSIRREFINTIVSDVNNEKSVEYIVEMFMHPQQSVVKVREYINSVEARGLDKSSEKYIICALIELSELLNDKSYCKLAFEVNSSRYIQLAQKYLESSLIRSIVPFEPAINKYLKTSIAQCSQSAERKIVYNQFKTDPIGAIAVVIRGLPEPKKKSLSRVSDKLRVFNPDEIYQCHKGPVGYTRDIVATYHRVGYDLYKILTYSDCLYDVIGRTTELPDQSGLVTRTDELFNKISWSDRLKLLPEFRAKVAINSISGSELNEYTGNSSDITVSWFNEDGLSCSKTFIMKKPKDVKIKNEC
nr:TPA: gp83-like protein [Oryctes rhinoceros nudivirus]